MTATIIPHPATATAASHNIECLLPLGDVPPLPAGYEAIVRIT